MKNITNVMCCRQFCVNMIKFLQYQTEVHISERIKLFEAKHKSNLERKNYHLKTNYLCII